MEEPLFISKSCLQIYNLRPEPHTLRLKFRSWLKTAKLFRFQYDAKPHFLHPYCNPTCKLKCPKLAINKSNNSFNISGDSHIIEWQVEDS